eukprot:gene5320-5554_t
MQSEFLHVLDPLLYTPAQLMFQQQRRHLDTLCQISMSIYMCQPEPQFTTCPACGYSGPSTVKRESGLCTYAACIGLWWLFCPLFWLPFCLDCDKDLVHRCGVCNAELARTKPC